MVLLAIDTSISAVYADPSLNLYYRFCCAAITFINACLYLEPSDSRASISQHAIKYPATLDAALASPARWLAPTSV